MLSSTVHYSGSNGAVSWECKSCADAAEFRTYLSDKVRERLYDEAVSASFEDELRGLATTQMASDTLRALLVTDAPKLDWEVGEAIAETVLEDDGIKWPWNSERDKRTPRASLPGADLVGFWDDGKDSELVFGEVKTSSDQTTPPGVMSGRSGMVHQLDQLALTPAIQFCLLKWLRTRCKNTEHWPIFERAVTKYLESGGRSLRLYGILMRDTQPHSLDLKNRAAALATNVLAPTSVRLIAWYLPEPIANWPTLSKRGAA